MAIDSNILSYFVDAINHGYNPHRDTDAIKDERVASLRISFYSCWYAVMPTVRAEYLKIKNSQKLGLHISVDEIFIEYSDAAFDFSEITKRAKYFNRFHTGKKNYNDCMIAAEAEFLSDTTVLLSNDHGLLAKVAPLTNGLLIIKPTDFVKRFDISSNRLRFSPTKTNPLYHETWWRF